MNAPLAGIRIVEVGHMLAGPYCGMMLADLGAEIIKIESPPHGDIGRAVSPHEVGDHNAYFASLNRSKKSVMLDLASTEGQADLARIVQSSQALITNLRPAAIRKLGLTYDALKQHNSALVCVSLTGYGLEGQYSDNPAYDYIIQALTGVMALTGDPSAPPTKAGYSAVDNSAGLVAAIGLLAKVVQGQGGQVDVAMYDVMMSQLNYLAGAVLNANEKMERIPNSSHPYIVPAQVFCTAKGWLALFITHDNFWKKFCTEIGRPEWVDTPKFATMAQRRENREFVVSQIEDILRTKSAKEWVQRLQPLGVVTAEIITLSDALSGDIAASRSLVTPLGDGSLPLRAIASPIKFTGFTPTYDLPPLLNQHSTEILGKVG